MTKKLLFFLFFSFSLNLLAQVQNVTFEIQPDPFDEDEMITITASNIDPGIWGVTDIYLWAWSSVDGVQQDAPNNGTWSNSNEAHKLTDNGNGTYSISFVPKDFYGRTNLETIGFLVKAKNGEGDKKSQDNVVAVGSEEVPPVTEAPVPAGMLDGINENPNDPSKVTLVLYAPLKEYIYVLGDFNDWQRQEEYLMFKDSSKDRFWIELTGLTPEFDHSYQYLVDGLIRVADPYSTVILDEFNDEAIDDTTYPDLPAYPKGKTSHAVTLLRTGEADFPWEVTDFEAPAKTDLVVYELLIRDFDQAHSFDAVRGRLDYLENMGINAIELMPINEFDNNESWGYNPSFHMALDKYYGTAEAFKRLVDECHKRGIAVIVDVVYNHGTGQNPFYRMWNTANGGYGGQATAENPFYNPEAKHAYSVFNDFDHSSAATRDYVKRTAQYWIDEYKIDGFRWDLTKGFTQNCSPDNTSCTNAYQADRVAVLKRYADDQWAVDEDFLVIFEHLGTNAEESEWVNYRLDEGKGIMMWSKLTDPYNESTMGYHENGKSDFSWIDYRERGWTVPANMSYMESHDEERLMYKNLTFGGSQGAYDVRDLDTALERQASIAAFFFLVPGPKMLWQFGEMGYDVSIDDPCRTCNKPIRWDYLDDPERKAVQEQWTKLIRLKLRESISRTEDFTLDVGNANGLKTLHLNNEDPGDDFKYLTVIGNFGLSTQSIDPKFQQTGTWYDLLNDNMPVTVTDVNQMISLAPGEIRVYGSQSAVLPVEEYQPSDKTVLMYPNPSKGNFWLNKSAEKVEIYDLTGRKVMEADGERWDGQAYDVSQLKPSIYFVRIEGEYGTQVERLIVE